MLHVTGFLGELGVDPYIDQCERTPDYFGSFGPLTYRRGHIKVMLSPIHESPRSLLHRIECMTAENSASHVAFSGEAAPSTLVYV